MHSLPCTVRTVQSKGTCCNAQAPVRGLEEFWHVFGPPLFMDQVRLACLRHMS